MSVFPASDLNFLSFTVYDILSLRVLLYLDEVLVLLLNPVWMDFQQASDS